MPQKRKLPRDAQGSQDSPYSKRSRRAKPNQTELAERILETIKSHQKEDGSLLANTFTKVPSKRQNPEYHEAVQEPIDLTRITQRMRMDEYRDIESLTADFDLLVSNTKKFYEEDSQEYKDATALWELYIDTKTAILSSDSPEETAPALMQEVEELSSRLDDIYNSLLAEVDEEGQGLSDMFMVLPDQKDYPDYYQKIKDPIDLTIIGEKIQHKQYKSLGEFERDLKQLIKNARTYNEPNSKIYNNANLLKLALQDRLLTESEKAEPSVKMSARLKQRNSTKFDGDGGLRRQDAIDLPESTVRSSRGTMLVQASITETTLKDKVDLQAKLYNEIVNYRNSLGHSISDAFVRLPNKHQHPAYYDEIENPISFKTIRRNILTKKYENLEALEEDLTLLFNNAMQYNQENSQIFKNAKTLMDFMTQKLPHYAKLEEEIEGSEDEIDESEEDEEAGDAEESDGETKKKPMKPRSSALKEKPQDVYRRRLRVIYDAVLEGKCDGRDMIGLFMEKPSRKDYPDYYKLILEPIDMKMIDKKIKQDKYPTVTSLVEDFNLMFTNAKHYNEPGSEVYQDAERLQEVLKKKLNELPPLPALEGGLMPTAKSDSSLQKSNTLLKNMELVYHKVRDYRDVTGREICEIFNRLPSKQELPDYYQVIKKPIENDRILQKLQSNSYTTMTEFMADMLLMFDNACNYNEPGSLIYKDALILQKVAIDACNEVVGPPKLPDVHAHVQELLTNLFVSVINFQDEEGRCYSDSLTLETPIIEGKQDQPMDTTQTNPTAASQPTPDPNQITLDTIRRNLHARRYKRLDVFQEHMFYVFETVRKSNRTDCEVYEDAVELQRFFIRIRDELCKNGEILMSPALSYTTKRLQSDVDAEKQEKLPAEALEDEAGKEEGKEMREKVERSVAEEGMDVLGITYQPGDFVYVEDTSEPGSNKPPHIVCIEKLYQDESGDQMLYGVWFYRPQDTYHVPTRKFLMKEVFKSDYNNTVKVSCIKGKCFVMIVKDYFKMKPTGYIEDDVYVCVSRYSSRMKSFKRIKQLNLPQNSTKIVQREKPLVPVRVSSVYSENVKDGADAPKLSDMLGPLVSDSIPWPTSVINRERPNIKVETAQDKQYTTTGQTYYLQYNINKMHLKVGDNVYVQQNGSDQRLKIARIESMWADINGLMWFQGSWFAQPCETQHEPTRMFYRNEVFLLSFKSMNNDEVVSSNPPPTPLSWVVSVCSVLSVRELTQCRPTEILEQHIHVCESRYLAADQVIKKIKGSLKKPAVSHKVVDDEYYYFKKPFEIPREISPQLVSSVRQELHDREEELQREREEENRRKLIGAHPPQAMVVAPQYPQQINPILPPAGPRQYPTVQQYPAQYQQVQYQQQPQPHMPQQPFLQPHMPSQQQQYIVQQHPPIQQQQQAQYTQYQPGTPYTSHPQMHQHQSPASAPMQTQPQIQQVYPQAIHHQQYTQAQSGIALVAQSPMQTGIRQPNTPIDHTETPASTTPTVTPTPKKKVRGGHSTGYILFASECHPRMRAEHPNMPFGEISKLVGEEWRSQTDEKKREYEERARELTAKAEAEGRPMQGKKKKKQQMRREMEEAAAAAQAQQQQQQQQQLQQQQMQQQQQQHPPPQPHLVIQQQQQAHGMVQQPQYHPGQYATSQPGFPPQQIPATPQHAPPSQYATQAPQIVSTPAPAQVQPAQTPTYATPVSANQNDQGAHHQPGTGMRRGPLFVKPPPKVQRVLHSEAYLRYIEGLEKGQTTISNFEKTLTVEEKDVQLSSADLAKLPTNWLANGKGQHESTKAALWALRDLMLKDALAIKNHYV